jgi:hypothetical protein
MCNRQSQLAADEAAVERYGGHTRSFSSEKIMQEFQQAQQRAAGSGGGGGGGFGSGLGPAGQAVPLAHLGGSRAGGELGLLSPGKGGGGGGGGAGAAGRPPLPLPLVGRAGGGGGSPGPTRPGAAAGREALSVEDDGRRSAPLSPGGAALAKVFGDPLGLL